MALDSKRIAPIADAEAVLAKHMFCPARKQYTTAAQQEAAHIFRCTLEDAWSDRHEHELTHRCRQRPTPLPSLARPIVPVNIHVSMRASIETARSSQSTTRSCGFPQLKPNHPVAQDEYKHCLANRTVYVAKRALLAAGTIPCRAR